MTEFISPMLIVAFAICGLILLAVGSLFFAFTVFKTQARDLADAMRLLASRGYTEFAEGSALEPSRRPPPIEPTKAQLQAAIAEDEFARAEADPFSQG